MVPNQQNSGTVIIKQNTGGTGESAEKYQVGQRPEAQQGTCIFNEGIAVEKKPAFMEFFHQQWAEEDYKKEREQQNH